MLVISAAACFTILLLRSSQALPVNTSTTDSAGCAAGHYWTSNGCLPCSTCSHNEITVQSCTVSANTVCYQCNSNSTQPQYVARDSSSTSHCKNCTICANSRREEVVPCSALADTVCGACLNGYFLGVGDEGEVKCLACSWCPPDDNAAIKWEECQNAGLPPDMWCSPGYRSSTTSNGPYSSTSSMKILSRDHFLSFTLESTSINLQTPSSFTLVVVIFIMLATTVTSTVTICSIIVCIRRLKIHSVSYVHFRDSL